MNWRGGKDISERDLTPKEIDAIRSRQKKFKRPASQLDILNMTAAITLELEKETTQIQETFSFEQLGINEQLPSDEIKKQIDHLFKNWVCDRLNLSYSIVVEENE